MRVDLTTIRLMLWFGICSIVPAGLLLESHRTRTQVLLVQMQTPDQGDMNSHCTVLQQQKDFDTHDIVPCELWQRSGARDITFQWHEIHFTILAQSSILAQ